MSQTKDIELETTFTYHPPTKDTIPRFQAIRDKCKELAYVIKELVPDGKEQTIAINMVESASMWANAGIARRTLDIGVGSPEEIAAHNDRMADADAHSD